jgi:hypothetical protein
MTLATERTNDRPPDRNRNLRHRLDGAARGRGGCWEDGVSTLEEFKAYCANLEAKRKDGRALVEAKERLMVSRLRRKEEPEEYTHEWHDGGTYEDWA